MTQLQEVEETRLSNLKLLHGTVNGFGGPTSKNFAKGLNIEASLLSRIYGKEVPIDAAFTGQIEKALSLPTGWLSTDQTFWLSVLPTELAIIKAYVSLSEPAKSHIAGIIEQLPRGAI